MSSDIQVTKNSVYTQSSFEDRLPSEFDTHLLIIPHPQAVFARHETFHPRFGWIKKGFDRTHQNGKVFLREDATTILGVGKNMVRSHCYWCIAFKVLVDIQEKSGRARDKLATPFGAKLLADDGWDPYLEDPASLWLLHWYLLKPPCYATTWHFIFTCFRRPDFSFESLLSALTEYVHQQFPQQNVAESSLQKDVSCLLHMYSASKSRTGAIEDILDSPFTTLGLIQSENDEKHYSFHLGYKSTLPAEIIVAACLELQIVLGKVKELFLFHV